MTVAVKSTSEVGAGSLLSKLAVDSFVGALAVFGGLALIFWVVPAFWSLAVAPLFGKLTYVSGALELVAVVGVILVLGAMGSRLLSAQSLPGLRAAIAVNCLTVLIGLLLVCAIGMRLEPVLGESNPTLGGVICVGIAFGILALLAYGYTRPAFDSLLVRIEEQGWFEARSYKRSQGQMVRRGTILGILVLAGCGIFTMLHHNTLATFEKDWKVMLPFASGQTITLLPSLRFSLPILLSALTLWLAYRVVNMPTFADFLIATEAEVNKVSWTTRKRLIQDTIVVLVTVILLTVFLFVVDQAWAFVLTRVGVIQITPASAQQQNPGQQPW